MGLLDIDTSEQKPVGLGVSEPPLYLWEVGWCPVPCPPDSLLLRCGYGSNSKAHCPHHGCAAGLSMRGKHCAATNSVGGLCVLVHTPCTLACGTTPFVAPAVATLLVGAEK